MFVEQGSGRVLLLYYDISIQGAWTGQTGPNQLVSMVVIRMFLYSIDGTPQSGLCLKGDTCQSSGYPSVGFF